MKDFVNRGSYYWAQFLCLFRFTQKGKYHFWEKRKCKIAQWCTLWADKNAYNLVLRDGFGDSFFILSLAHELAKVNHVKLFFLVKPSQVLLLKMFGFNNYKVLKMLNAKDLMTHTINQAPYPTQGNVFFPHPRYHWQTEGLMSESKCFVDVFRRLFRLPLKTPLASPCWWPDINNKLSKKIKKAGGINNIVLLTPETNLSITANLMWWKKLAESLQNRGYFVVCNVCKGANKIAGTADWNLSVEELLALGARCRAVVSIRSGLCDLFAKKRKNLFVLDAPFHSATEKNFFNLNFNFNIKEVNEYSDEKQIPIETLVDKIANIKNL